ncbi:MAG TPA: DUF2254 family protein [Azospirillaceae bacterium]|nr:DUF2254 family protein [Azospirillaceae bacterium]
MVPAQPSGGGGVEDARSLLSTLLSSMITMTSLVFSITMVVLAQAASQFGPRLIRSYMADPGTQVVLGIQVMTIVYLLLASTFCWRSAAWTAAPAQPRPMSP